MALRKIRITGDPILRKRSKVVEKVDDRTRELLEDIIETMRESNGVGLAAPQVGVLRRVVVIDVGDGPIKMVNPEIIYQEGEEIDTEGCLSVPNFMGTVARPQLLRVGYMDENGMPCELEAEGLKARAVCHEIDHLNGVLFTDIYLEEVVFEDEDGEKNDKEK